MDFPVTILRPNCPAIFAAAVGGGADVAWVNTNTPTHVASNSFSSPMTVTPGGSNKLLTVPIVFSGNALVDGAITAISYGGQAMTSAGAAIITADATTAEKMFYLVNPPTGSNSLDITGDGTVLSIYANATSYANADQTTPVRVGSLNSATGAAVSPNNIVITSAAGDMTTTVACQPTNTITSTDQTSDGIDNGGSRDLGSDHAVGAASVTHNWAWGGSGSAYLLYGFSIKKA